MRDLASPGSDFRRQCWLDAGSPVADMRRLQYAGSDAVRWVLESTLRQLPPEVAWFSIEAIDWTEVGRDCYAWAHHQPTARTLPGDIGHRVNICGVVPDEALPGLLAHEVSHRWRKPVETVVPSPLPLASVDMIAVRIYARSRVSTEDEQWLDRACWISARVAEELRADDQVRAWGFDWRGHDPDKLRRRFAGQYDEARRLARLAAELDDEEHVGIAASTAAIQESE